LCFNNNINKINIENRYVDINKNVISVGKNLKEIENGYYDFKIDIQKHKIIIYINKLFKQDVYMNMYDDKYIDTIVNYINVLFELKLDIKEYIIKNYTLIREIKNLNKPKHFIYDIKNSNVKIKIEKNILVIEV
jgi:hypothetical protein